MSSSDLPAIGIDHPYRHVTTTTPVPDGGIRAKTGRPRLRLATDHDQADVAFVLFLDGYSPTGAGRCNGRDTAVFAVAATSSRRAAAGMGRA